MNYSQYIFGLELNNANSQHAIACKVNDTGRKLFINLTQDSNPYTITEDCWVLFVAKKPDGTNIVNECMISNNIVEYALTQQTVAATGVLNCAIAIYGLVNNVATALHSAMFNIVVYDEVVATDDIISSDEYLAFLNASSQLQTLLDESQEVIDAYNEMRTQVDDHESRITLNEEHIATNRTGLLNVKNKADANESRITLNEEHIATNRTGLLNVKNKADTNESRIGELETTVTTQGNLLDNIHRKTLTNAAAIAEFRISVGDLQSITSGQATTINSLVEQVNTNADNIATNRTGLLNVKNKADVNETRIDELEATIEELQETGISAEVLEELNGKIASNTEVINDNQHYINLLARYNAIGWLSDINAFSKMIDNVKYSWNPSTGQFNVVCNNTASTSYDFVTLDLTSPNLKGQTITLDVVGGSGSGVYAFYTAVNSSGVMTTHSVINESISWTYGSIDTLTIAIKTANGYKGQMMLRLTVTTGKSHKELISSITAVSDRVTALEETGGATGADGKSAYEIWLEQGNTGTVDDFLASLVGESITITDTELIITDGGATKTKLTFSDGTSITISDGANGAKGADGDDGKSIEITNIELSEEDGGENKITFSDGELDSVIVIRNGNKGSTPVKGTDYFTEADKAELVADVLEALPTWTGGSY